MNSRLKLATMLELHLYEIIKFPDTWQTDPDMKPNYPLSFSNIEFLGVRFKQFCYRSLKSLYKGVFHIFKSLFLSIDIDHMC